MGMGGRQNHRECWEVAGVWEGTPPPLASVPDEAAKPTRISIAGAVKVFLTSREGAKIAQATLRKYRTFTKQLTDFIDQCGYFMLDQITSADIDAFYSTWKLGARTKGKRLGTLRAFFRFCMYREWLPKNPVSPDAKPPIGANRVANKAPYTDDELQRIIDACDKFGTVTWSTGREQGACSGDDLKDFIWVMVYTGLRISNVGLFHIDRLKGNEVFRRAKENGGEVFAYIPDWLAQRLDVRDAMRRATLCRWAIGPARNCNRYVASEDWQGV
jgi:integrase